MRSGPCDLLENPERAPAKSRPPNIRPEEPWAPQGSDGGISRATNDIGSRAGHRKEDPLELVIRPLERGGPASHEIEVVERKGLGHPDTICDGVAEHFCVRLCRYYLENFGSILHHNVDKALLCGGAARPAFGGGEVLEPIEIYLSGRATHEYGGRRIPVSEIAEDSCREWLRNNLPQLDIDRHVRVVPRLRAGSADLTGLFVRDQKAPGANDTSCGAGFAPLTDLERVVLEVERGLNSRQTKSSHPEIGTDIKIMGVRHGDRIDLTIGCAFIGRFVPDLDDYIRRRAAAGQLALESARRATRLEVRGVINAADDLERGDVFLTVTGTSAEAGDDGEVGRGNRTSGLITPYRSMTMEAAAGKNPVTHVGKLYNLLAFRIAETITSELSDVREAECLLVSRIGHPVTDPQLVDIRLSTGKEALDDSLRPRLESIVRGELGRLSELRRALLEERIAVY